MADLSGKVNLVTGGGSGINLAFTRLLIEAGCKVLIADLGLHAQAEEWIASIESDAEKRARVHFHKTDVTEWAQLTAAFEACAEKFGTKAPDIVVPGAGVFEPTTNSFWGDNDTDSRFKVFDIDLVHPVKLSRMAISRLREAKKPGAIVHVSSVAGQFASLSAPLYCIAKHGINAFVWAMASLEEMCGIRVVAVAPDATKSPLYNESALATQLAAANYSVLETETVAEAMFAVMTQKETYKGGTVLEVCHPTDWRVVNRLNDPGPQGLPANVRSKQIEMVGRVLKVDE
ncbi:hypothetical protein MW887_003123 [Aspergillus wentii]|nr:hypothetical protein MW887_003123 [Aspergillus wentii]